jgi:hypothetical protein
MEQQQRQQEQNIQQTQEQDQYPQLSISDIGGDPLAGDQSSVSAGEYIAKTITDIPLQTIGALRDAMQGVYDTADGVANMLNDLGIPDFGIKLYDDKGDLSPEFVLMLKGERTESGASLPELPGIPDAKTGTGEFYRKVMQFVLPFNQVNKALQGTKAAATLGTIGTDLTAGVITDFTFWEKQEERLSDLVQSIDGLQNPVTEFLSSNEDDPIVLDKIKIALEGAALGGLVHTVVGGLRTLKAARNAQKAKAEVEATGIDIDVAAQQAKQVESDLAGSALGLPDQPSVEFKALQPEEAQQVMQNRAVNDELGGLDYLYRTGDQVTPEDVTNAAKGSEVSALFPESNRLSEIDKTGGMWGAIKEANPNIPETGKVTVYRASIGEGIRPNDFVAIDKNIANEHLANLADRGEKGKIIKEEVNFNDLLMANDATEFIYHPKPTKPQVPLNDIGRPVINFRTIDAPEDIDNVLREMTDRLEDTATQAKGGIISHEETKALARQVGIKELMDPTMDVARFNRAELVALKDLYVSSGEKLLQVADQANAAPTSANLWAFRKMMAVHNEIYGRFVGAKAEAGRALNALKIPSQAGNLERLHMIQSSLDGMGGEEVAKELAGKVSALKNAEPEMLTEITRRGVGAKTMDAVREAWVLGLLSGPTTQARNILSNVAYMYQSVVERGVAARIPGSQVQKGEALAYAFGTMQSMRQAFTNAGRAFKTGVSGYGVGKIETPHQHAISAEALGLRGGLGYLADGVGEFYRVWGRLLTGGDELFKTMNFHGELWAQSVRKASQEGISSKAEFADKVAKYAMEPDEAMRIAGRDAAEYATFTKKLGPLGQKWQSMVSEYAPLGFLTPFIRTPANIFKAGFERSPVALAMPGFWRDVKAGGTKKDMALAKFAFGSSAMALFSDITMRGYISGSGPSAPGERARLRDTGWAPYSINIGAIQGGPDQWINYRSIEPIGMVLGLSADVTELMMQRNKMIESDNPEEQAKADRLFLSAIAAVGNSVTSQTFVRSISEFFNMMSNPDMYAGRWLQNYARTVVPRLGASVEKIVDPELREVNSLMDAMRQDIPGLSDELPAMRSTFGHPIELGGALGPDWISPIWMSEDTNSPIAKELVSQQIGLGKPSRVTTFQDSTFGMGVRMNLRDFPKAYERFQVLAGHELKHPAFGLGLEDLLNKIVTGKHHLSAIYNRLMDGDEAGLENKGAFIKDLAAEYRQLARNQLLREFPDLKEQVQIRARRKYQLQLQGAAGL